MLRVTYSRQSLKGLKDIPLTDRQKLLSKIEAIAGDDGDLTRHPYATKLVGSDTYRVRQGQWRALYAVDLETGAMTVLDARHRKEIYR